MVNGGFIKFRNGGQSWPLSSCFMNQIEAKCIRAYRYERATLQSLIVPFNPIQLDFESVFTQKVKGKKPKYKY